MSSSPYDHLCKILVIGDTFVGKTALITRLSGQSFIEQTNETVGVDFYIETLLVDGLRVRLQIWDTAGIAKLNTVTPDHYERAVGVILVYSVTDKSTFDDIPGWLDIVRDYSSENVEKLIIGNKCDLESERAVKSEQGIELARASRSLFYETSARQNYNILQAFVALSRRVLANPNLIPLTIFRQASDHQLAIPMSLRIAAEKQRRRRERYRACCRVS